LKRSLKCLILLPFDASAKRLSATVQQVLRENKIEVLSPAAENFRPGALWVDELLGMLRASDFLIADVSRKNPNVIFELGVAHGLGKPFVLLLSSDADAATLPSDLTGYQTLSYDQSNLSGLATRLARVVESVATRVEHP